jgi:selenocysteine lyase/cysteine desulfurase
MLNRRHFIKTLGLGGLALQAFSGKGQNQSSSTYRSSFLLESDRIYLNNGTMGLSPREVVDATIKAIQLVEETGTYGGGDKELRKELAAFLGCIAEEIGITHNVTESTNYILGGLRFSKGDEIICTTHEHVGTALPLLEIAAKNKALLKKAAISLDPHQTTRNILSLISKKTKLICIPHMPCTTGQLLDVNTIIQAAKARGILTLIDGAHPPGMIQVNLHAMGCDFYVGCGHKWMLGPKGTGFVYAQKDVLTKVEPLFAGAGTHEHFVLDEIETKRGIPVNNANRFYYGSQNAAIYAGWVAAIHYLQNIGMDKVETHCKTLSGSLRQQVLALPTTKKIEVYCPEDPQFRTGVCTFKIEGIASEAFVQQMRSKKIILRHVHENKLDLIRVSTHLYNSAEEIDRLLFELKNLC